MKHYNIHSHATGINQLKKIEDCIQFDDITSDITSDIASKMKTTYYTNIELNCGVAKCGDKEYLMDHSDKDMILNFHKKFSLMALEDTYPSYGENSKRISYLEFLYKFNTEQNVYIFKNGNKI